MTTMEAIDLRRSALSMTMNSNATRITNMAKAMVVEVVLTVE
jgi:hypothetical protein